jgi:hypothetical protein
MHNKQGAAFNRHILYTNKPPILDSSMCLNWHLTQLWDPDGEFLEAAPVYLRQQLVNRAQSALVREVYSYSPSLSLSHTLSLSLPLSHSPEGLAGLRVEWTHSVMWNAMTGQSSLLNVAFVDVPVYDAIAWYITISLEPFKWKLSCRVTCVGPAYTGVNGCCKLKCILNKSVHLLLIGFHSAR